MTRAGGVWKMDIAGIAAMTGLTKAELPQWQAGMAAKQAGYAALRADVQAGKVMTLEEAVKRLQGN